MKPKDIQRIISSTDAQTASIEIVELFSKYQEEQDKKLYSEEDMINFAEFVASYPDKNRNYLNQMLHAKSKYHGSERTIDLLGLFKKK